MQRLKEEEWQRDMEWDRQRVNMAKAGTVYEQRHERLREEIRREQDKANVHLDAEQKAQYVFFFITVLEYFHPFFESWRNDKCITVV